MLQRLTNQPYLLLVLSQLFWAGNIIVGRGIAEEIPPVLLSLIRWAGAFLLILPWALPQLKTDWRTLRTHLGFMVLLAFTGISTYNTLSYWGLGHTQALNALLMQSSTPLFLALWSLVLFGIRLTGAQMAGITLSLAGVLTIVVRGDFVSLRDVDLNIGDIAFLVALAVFGLYSVLIMKRPAITSMSFLAFTFGVGALPLMPLAAAEYAAGHVMEITPRTLLALLYVVIFPSTLSYLCYNRGIALIGANRAAPFSHLIPVFGSVMAILFLGERLQVFHLVGYALVLVGVFVAARKRTPALQ